MVSGEDSTPPISAGVLGLVPRQGTISVQPDFYLKK